MPRIGFFVKAGRHFVKRMETHKFVNTNLLIDPYPFQLGSQFASRIVAASGGLIQSSSSAKNVRLENLVRLEKLAKICKNNARPVYLKVRWKFAKFYVYYPHYASSNTYALFLYFYIL